MKLVDAIVLSKANGGYYDGDRLPENRWEWPAGTWLQRRRASLKRCTEDHEGGAGCDISFPCWHDPSKCIREPLGNVSELGKSCLPTENSPKNDPVTSENH